MTITKRAGRQCISSAYVDIGVADVVSGVAQAAIELPPGSIVVGGDAVTTEAWNSTTSDVFAVGDDTTANRYGSALNIRSLGRVALVPTGFVTTATQRNVNVTWTSGGGTPTTGKTRLRVDYIVENRADHTVG